MLKYLHKPSFKLSGASKEEVIAFLVEKMASLGNLDDPELFYQLVMKREQIGSTYIGKAAAFPHARIGNKSDSFFIVSALLERPIVWSDVDEVNRVFLIKGPIGQEDQYLQMLSQLTAFIKKENLEIAGGIVQ